jgi:hypothetical protein
MIRAFQFRCRPPMGKQHLVDLVDAATFPFHQLQIMEKAARWSLRRTDECRMFRGVTPRGNGPGFTTCRSGCRYSDISTRVPGRCTNAFTRSSRTTFIVRHVLKRPSGSYTARENPELAPHRLDHLHGERE